MRSISRRAAVVVVMVLLAAAACGGGDPEMRLRVARAGYDLQLRNWAERGSEAGQPREGLFTIFVSRTSSTVELPCLTVDIVFQGEADGSEIARSTIELDIAELASRGGSMDVTTKLALPEANVAGLAVVLHEPKDGAALRALCEAKGIPELAR